jgi:hypothetical protein
MITQQARLQYEFARIILLSLQLKRFADTIISEKARVQKYAKVRGRHNPQAVKEKKIWLYQRYIKKQTNKAESQFKPRLASHCCPQNQHSA